MSKKRGRSPRPPKALTLDAASLLAPPESAGGAFAALQRLPRWAPVEVRVQKGDLKKPADADRLVKLLESRLANVSFKTDDARSSAVLSHARRVAGVHLTDAILAAPRRARKGA